MRTSCTAAAIGIASRAPTTPSRPAPSSTGFSISALNGAHLVGRAAREGAAPAFEVEPIVFNNNTDDSGPQFKIKTVTPAQKRLEQVTVMALTPAGAPAATTTVLPLTGAREMFAKLADNPLWPSFGVIAAETELARESADGKSARVEP